MQIHMTLIGDLLCAKHSDRDLRIFFSTSEEDSRKCHCLMDLSWLLEGTELGVQTGDNAVHELGWERRGEGEQGVVGLGLPGIRR